MTDYRQHNVHAELVEVRDIPGDLIRSMQDTPDAGLLDYAAAAHAFYAPLLAEKAAEIRRLAKRINEVDHARAYAVDELAHVRDLGLALISRLVLAATSNWDPDANIEDQVAKAEDRIAQFHRLAADLKQRVAEAYNAAAREAGEPDHG